MNKREELGWAHRLIDILLLMQRPCLCARLSGEGTERPFNSCGLPDLTDAKLQKKDKDI